VTLDELVEKLEDLQSYGFGKNSVVVSHCGSIAFEDVTVVEARKLFFDDAKESVVIQ
jgi:hypothetical protein